MTYAANTRAYAMTVCQCINVAMGLELENVVIRPELASSAWQHGCKHASRGIGPLHVWCVRV